MTHATWECIKETSDLPLSAGDVSGALENLNKLV